MVDDQLQLRRYRQAHTGVSERLYTGFREPCRTHIHNCLCPEYHIARTTHSNTFAYGWARIRKDMGRDLSHDRRDDRDGRDLLYLKIFCAISGREHAERQREKAGRRTVEKRFYNNPVLQNRTARPVRGP